MSIESFRNLCLFYTLDGLRDGLSHFSGPSRAALIFAVKPDDPICIYDPQNLLHGHEPILKELYLQSNQWRKGVSENVLKMMLSGHIHAEKNLQLAGLISYGGRSRSIFYQMWFTEHHPNMCSIGPTECWLEHAVWFLSHDFATQDPLYVRTSGNVLREYATHAVRDYIIDQMNVVLGWDTQIRVYPILDAVLGISMTREERAWPVGELSFVEPKAISEVEFLARFPLLEQPNLNNFKHIRKLLQSVENSNRKLISDGKTIVGIASGVADKFHITVDFKGEYGFLSINGNPVCSFSNGSFHSTTHQAKLVEVEEALLESNIDSATGHKLFKIITRIVHMAERKKYGCTLVIDLNDSPIEIAGQKSEIALDLTKEPFLRLSEALAKLDGALHIGADLKLHGFACLLDGLAVPGEDRSRGARFNSALRFTAANAKIIVVVVSVDRPISVIQEGVELNAQCEWKPVHGCIAPPPTLEQFLK
ncbi:MAG TPA: DNA integrity scanning protein DisA nucleotide-binding domain protein [Desulfobacterales bacterium]|nr:DNA integrity scanning protein DisA nucleotide-binding domain protein [Desulfobacterales bacterium]